jgi:hypothetical protein
MPMGPIMGFNKILQREGRDESANPANQTATLSEMGPIMQFQKIMRIMKSVCVLQELLR